MSHKPHSTPLPSNANPPLLTGFTTWVELHRSTASAVLWFRRAVDQHLASRGLVLSMNPLHMLVWSPERSLAADDQLALLHWMLTLGGVERVGMTSLRAHVGIPMEPRAQALQVSLSDPRVQAALFDYRYGGQCAATSMSALRQATAGCA